MDPREEEDLLDDPRQSSASRASAPQISSDALRQLESGARDRLRRNVLFAGTGAATTLSLAFWLIAILKGGGSVEQLLVPLLSLVFGTLTLLAWLGWLRTAELGLLVVGSGILLERIHATRYSDNAGLLPVLDAYELLIWLPCIYVFAFLVLEKRKALLGCLALLAASLLIVHGWTTPGGAPIHRLDVTEFYIAQLACIFLVYAFARLKERLLSTQELAMALRGFAETDFLTGVANRRLLSESLDREIRRCERHGGPLSVILLDIDHFKRINDEHGHEEGDRALRRVALLMDRSRRQTDLFGRWGGEEFLLLAPGLRLDQAHRAAERLRELIDGGGDGGPISFTASFGVAEYRAGDDGAKLVHRADRALLEAKGSGRNRVVACAA